jgi:hypothetical protein
MTKELFVEEAELSFSVEPMSPTLMESVRKSGGNIVLKGVPATILDVENGNGRKYSKKEMTKAIRKLRESGAFKARKFRPPDIADFGDWNH